MNKADIHFFDMMAPKWDEIATVNPEKIRYILNVANIPDCHSILDVGTGTGVLIPFMVEQASDDVQIDAVDISEGMLKEAKRKHGSLENVSFTQTDIETEQMDKTYDCIIMYCMYPHLTQPEETVEWLAKVNLNHGGRLVIAFPEGKGSINSIHHHNDGSVHSTKLIDASLLKSRLEARGLDVDYTEDNDDYFIIRIVNSHG